MKKIFYPILIAILGLSFASCESLLDIDQPDVLEQEHNFQSKEDTRSTMLGIYKAYQELYENYFLISELRGDLVQTTDNAPLAMQELNECIYTAGNPYTSPAPFYRVVNQVNDLMDNLPVIQENIASFTSEDSVRLVAESTYLRATAYLMLIRIYKDVIYFEQPLNNYEEGFTMAAMPKAQIVDTLITQVERYAGMKIMTNDDVGTGQDQAWYRYRFTNYPPYQLMGELALEKHDYISAITHLKGVTHNDAGDFWKLSKNKNEVWKVIHYNQAAAFTAGIETSREWLLAIPFYKQYGQTNEMSNWCDKDKKFYLQPSPNLIQKFVLENGSAGDKYRGRNITFRLENDIPELTKFFNNPDMAEFDNDSYFVMWRAGDSWLDLCEALNRSGGMDNKREAIESLNKVRARVSLNEVDTSFMVGESEEAIQLIIDRLILDERVKETAFECNRFYDLVRYADYYNQPILLANPIAAKFDDDKQAIVRERLTNTENWYIPWDAGAMDTSAVAL